MSIKYNNADGLNERKSNQGAMKIRPDYDPDKLDEKYFEVKHGEQERVEQGAGEGGYTSGESFDKYPASEEKEGLKSKAIGEAMKDHKEEDKNDKKIQLDSDETKLTKDERPHKKESDDTYVSKKILNQNNHKAQIDQQQNYKPRDNA